MFLESSFWGTCTLVATLGNFDHRSTPFARRVLNDVFPILSIISVYAQGLSQYFEAFRESMIDGIPCSLSIGTT